MKRSWWFRFVFLLLVLGLSIMVVVPTAFNLSEESSYPVKSKISLGLDLQGGLYMILGIDFHKVYKDEIKSYMKKVEYVLNDYGIKASLGDLDVSDPSDPKHSIIINSAADFDKAHDKLKDYFRYPLRLTGKTATSLQYALNYPIKIDIEKNSVSKSIEVIRNRIDEFGVTEPEIISQGSNRIVVQLPGVKDIERAKDLIGKTAKLEFKLVNDDVDAGALSGWVTKGEKAGIIYEQGQRFSMFINKLNDHLRKDLPKGYEIAFQKTVNKNTNLLESKVPFLVESATRLTGDDLQDARVDIDRQNNTPYVSMNFKSRGANIFGEITGKNIGKRLAVILDGNVYTAPVIQSKIGGGRAQITLGQGNYNELMKQARDIALVLRAGALPVQLDFEEQRIVGPTLGADSIKTARFASIIGCALVFLFILFYYKFSGLITVFTLSVNVLIIMAFLVGLGATLTLPGIAGIALTVGMAVDATIIIFQRIREELAKGNNNRKSVETGFDKAFWTILDANITTALAGLCLLNFGTGPIRGFAVTLLIGIIGTVYTSYFVGRMLFELYMDKVEGKELSI